MLRTGWEKTGSPAQLGAQAQGPVPGLWHHPLFAASEGRALCRHLLARHGTQELWSAWTFQTLLPVANILALRGENPCNYPLPPQARPIAPTSWSLGVKVEDGRLQRRRVQAKPFCPEFPPPA